MAAIHEQRGASYIRRQIRGEESAGVGDFLRIAAAPQRNVPEVIFQYLGIRKLPLGEACADEPRANRVNANPVGSQFVRRGMQ